MLRGSDREEGVMAAKVSLCVFFYMHAGVCRTKEVARQLRF